MSPHLKRPLGVRLREERKRRAWTLATLGARCGISASALSKVENGRITLGYDNLRRVARGLGIDVSALFAGEENQAPGRRSHSRADARQAVRIPGYRLHYLATELVGKRFVPMLVTVTARDLAQAGGLKFHGGEEVYYVVEGTAVLHSSAYAPVKVRAGECIYMDGRIGHAFVASGAKPAKIFSVNEGYAVHSLETGELCLPGGIQSAAELGTKPRRRS